jgi:hypothetical protein
MAPLLVAPLLVAPLLVAPLLVAPLLVAPLLVARSELFGPGHFVGYQTWYMNSLVERPKGLSNQGLPVKYMVRAFQTRTFRRTRTQTEVRNSDSDSGSDLRNRDFPTP